MEEKLEKLTKLGALHELIEKCREFAEIDSIASDYTIDLLKDASNETYRSLEELKSEFQ